LDVDSADSPAPVEIRVLGPLAVHREGREQALPRSRKARALLVLLALEPRVHTRAKLCDLLFPDPADPRAALRWTLSKLRTVLGDENALVGDRAGLALDDRRARTDAAELNRMAAAPAGASIEALERLASAVALDHLSELAAGTTPEFELWLESQRETLGRQYQRLLAELVRRHADEPERALPHARQRVAVDPLNVAANAELLGLLLTVRGRDEARAAFEAMRRRFLQAGLAGDGLLAAWRRLAAPDTVDHRQHPERVELLRPEGADAVVPERPSVAVLGFDDLGGHPGGAVLAEGLAVDLNLRLGRLGSLFVLAHASARRFSLRESSAAEIGRRLGVRNLIHGTTRRLDRRLRVTVELVDTAGGLEVWSDRYDRPLDDLFAVQDEIADAAAAALEPAIERAEMSRARLKPPEHRDAWECYHLAMWHAFRFTAHDNAQAQTLLERALAMDPLFARAHAAQSFGYFPQAFLDAAKDPAATLRRAVESARRSVDLAGRDAMGHCALGRALFLGREHEAALAAIDRALIANPNYAQGRYPRGFVGAHSGIPEQAATDLALAERLSPFDPLLFAMKSSRAIALAIGGRSDEAAHLAVEATREANAHFHIAAVAGACLELAGRHDEAGAQIAAALRSHSGYTIAVFERSFPYQKSSDGALMRSALLRAGLPRGA
jgi:TolB-like protein/DNA-binding SARP family transcriptional activator